MESSIHLYKLFENTKSPIPIQIPETIIIGYGFVFPTLITYSSHLLFTTLTAEKAREHLLFLYSSFTVLCKSSKNSYTLTELPTDLGSEVMYQVYVPGKACIARWSSGGGFLSIEYPVTLRLQFEYIKNLINKQLNNTSRLAKLEVEFIISSHSIIYCIAVTNYAYTQLKSLTRVNSLKSVKSTQKPVTRKNLSQNLTPVWMPKNKMVIEDQLSELIKDSNSIKYIRFNQWKNIADRGEPLLSNEKLYSKRIAGISTLVLVKSTKSVKEVRKMIGLMRDKVYKEKKNKKAMTIKLIDTYRISLKSEKTSSKDNFSLTANRAVANILNRASNDLDSFKKKKVDNNF